MKAHNSEVGVFVRVRPTANFAQDLIECLPDGQVTGFNATIKIQLNRKIADFVFLNFKNKIKIKLIYLCPAGIILLSKPLMRLKLVNW